MEEIYDKQKEASGGVSTLVFNLSGLYLFIANLGFSSLISLKALIFFVVGMFSAAFLIGSATHWLQRLVAKLHGKIFHDYSSKFFAPSLQISAWLLFIGQVGVTIFATDVVFKWWML